MHDDEFHNGRWRRENGIAQPRVARAPQPRPDPRIGLRAGAQDAAEAVWNLRILSRTPQPAELRGNINSDLASTGPFAIQGNFRG